ncbi:DotA/TraY family protein [Pseudomonas aeruginosa]
MSQAEAAGFIDTIMNMEYKEDDIANHALAQLFGGFIFEPYGNAPSNPATALTKVLGYTNIVAMILGLVVVAYVMFAGAINTAASGEVLGRGWSAYWVPLRTGIAFGLITPAGSGGEVFSVAQYLVISLIILGSNAATWLWEQGATALSTGSPVMATTAHYSSGEFANLTKIVYCAAVREKMLKEKDGESPKQITVFNRNDASAGRARVSKTYTYDQVGSLDLSKASTISFERCGSIAIPTANSVLDGTAEENTKAGLFSPKTWEVQMQQNFNAAVVANYSSTLRAAKTFSDLMIADKMNGKLISAKFAEGLDEKKAMESAIDAEAANYMLVSKAYDQYIEGVRSSLVTPNIADQWKADMIKGGWARAGVWFFEASRLQGYAQTLLSGLNNVSSYNNPGAAEISCSFLKYFGSSCKDQADEFESWKAGLSYVEQAAGSLSETESSGAASGKTIKLSAKSPDGDIDSSFIDSMSASTAQVVLSSLTWLGSDDAKGTGGSSGSGAGMTTDVSGMVSPFTTVSAIGRGLQQISTTTWVIGLGASAYLGWKGTAVGMAADVATGGTWGAVDGTIRYVLATLVPIMAGVAGLSFMLAFAIPFMPVTVWIMLVCGYFVTVIEAIASAPLAVVMLATPEGEGISGHNFNRALQMVNAIILKPTLSIVGLFAAMTLSYVGFAILNNLFWSVASLATSFSFFEIMAILFIYCTIAFKVCEFMIEIIHTLPNHILEWMGGGQGRSFGEGGAAQGITGSLTQNATAGGLMTGQGMNAMKGTAQRAMERKHRNDLMEAMRKRDDPADPSIT